MRIHSASRPGARIELIAFGTISGLEARGDVTLTRKGEGVVTLLISNVWIAPGAPDVRIYLSSDPEGDFRSGTMTELGKVTELTGELSYDVPADLEPSDMRSLVVYCSVYSVTFGVAALVYTGTTGA